MTKYETTFGIGDVVYTANMNNIERQIITRIKITGLNHRISYGFKETSNYILTFFASDEKWYTSSSVFETEEAAGKRHKSLKVRYEADESKRRKKADANRIKELEEELKKLKGRR